MRPFFLLMWCGEPNERPEEVAARRKIVPVEQLLTQQTILLICEQATAKSTNVTKAVTEAKLLSRKSAKLTWQVRARKFPFSQL